MKNEGEVSYLEQEKEEESSWREGVVNDSYYLQFFMPFQKEKREGNIYIYKYTK